MLRNSTRFILLFHIYASQAKWLQFQKISLLKNCLFALYKRFKQLTIFVRVLVFMLTGFSVENGVQGYNQKNSLRGSSQINVIKNGNMLKVSKVNVVYWVEIISLTNKFEIQGVLLRFTSPLVTKWRSAYIFWKLTSEKIC